MYPSAIILGIGWYIEDMKLPYYVLPFSVIGVGVSTFHYLHQKTEWFTQAVVCTQGVPCSGMYINWLGFITIPFLALIAFLSISVIMITMLKKN